MSKKNQKITVGLVQVNNTYDYSGNNHYLPLSTGSLVAYFQANSSCKDRYVFLPLEFMRRPISEMVNELFCADFVGFSIYNWNAKYSLEVARRLKLKNPSIFIFFGGPHVPDRSEPFLRENDFIDICVHNEGEQTFLELLETYPSKSWREIDGISFLTNCNQYVQNKPRQRLADFSKVPSPYLAGVFDPIIEKYRDVRWMALWETNRGCPFSCTFCDWGSATQAKVRSFDIARLKSEVDWFSKIGVDYIFCCDANFGILERDIELSEYLAVKKSTTGHPKTVFVQSTKNATERSYKVQKLLHESGLGKGVALSMQSVDEHTLELIKRKNISLDSYRELQRRFIKDGVPTYSDLILGLPGETSDAFLQGMVKLIDWGQHNRINTNALCILPNAEMNTPEQLEEHGFKLIESTIGTQHGSKLTDVDDVHETQQVVVATNAMPEADWQHARAISWFITAMHFDKIFQIPSIVANRLGDLGYLEMYRCFFDAEKERYPTIHFVNNFLLDRAKETQQGGQIFFNSKRFLGINWNADQLIYMTLCERGEIDLFFQEAESLLLSLLAKKQLGVDVEQCVVEAAKINRALLKQPFINSDITLKCDFNTWEIYQKGLLGEDVKLNRQNEFIMIDRSSHTWQNIEDWCREVVWHQYSRGGFLYRCHVNTSDKVEMLLDATA